MPEGESIPIIETRKIETKKLPALPLDTGVKLVGEALGFYGDHLVRRPESIERISVGEYPSKPTGEHDEAIVVILDSGQVVAVREVAEGKKPQLTRAYQQVGREHGAPILSLLQKPGDHAGNPTGRDVIKELMQELGTPETVQTYEKAA